MKIEMQTNGGTWLKFTDSGRDNYILEIVDRSGYSVVSGAVSKAEIRRLAKAS
jgi:hypothetical protein